MIGRALAGASLLALAACTLGPDFKAPDPPTVGGYGASPLPATTGSASDPAGQAQRFVQAEDIPGQWWSLFRSPALDSLTAEALKSNPSLDAARAALRAAQENALAQEGALQPQVGASAAIQRERISGIPSGEPKFDDYLTVNTVSVSVSYAADVFGGGRRQLESLEAQAAYARYELEAAYLTLTSNLVATAVQEAALRGEIDATQEIIKVEGEQLDVLQHQFDLGAVSKAAVLAEAATLAQAKATLPGLTRQLGQERDLLTALVGRLPSDEPSQQFTLADIHLPADLPVTVPSKLVEHRPDIQAAEATLHSASAQIGVAEANRFPQLNLTGQMGSEALTIPTLFYPPGSVFALGGSLAQSLFNGGSLEHKQRAAEAQYDQAQAQYRGTVVAAFQSVADALRAIQTDADALAAQVASERAAADSLALSNDQFKVGAISYSALLDAQRTYLQTRIALIEAEAARYADTAALFQAMGGGWWNRDDLTPAK